MQLLDPLNCKQISKFFSPYLTAADKGFSANAFAALIRNNLAISVVIFVVIGLVLLAVIILPILSKKRKKMDAADAEKLN